MYYSKYHSESVKFCKEKVLKLALMWVFSSTYMTISFVLLLLKFHMQSGNRHLQMY